MYHELDAFIRIRQDNLTSDLHKGTVRATTILVTSIPKQFLDVNTLRQVFSVFPGGVKNVFLNRDCSDLLDMVQLRDSIAQQLEGAETELICTANKLHRKEVAKKTKQAKKKQKKGTEGEQMEEAEERIEMKENESLVDRYVPNKKRPTYRIPLAKWMPSLPLIGKKVLPPNSIPADRVGRHSEMGPRRTEKNEPHDSPSSSPTRTLRRHEFSVHPIQHTTRSPHGLSVRRIPQANVHDPALHRNSARGRRLGQHATRLVAARHPRLPHQFGYRRTHHLLCHPHRLCRLHQQHYVFDKFVALVEMDL
jgi:Cytosolic domain of 10TM putative phosphate transporter